MKKRLMFYATGKDFRNNWDEDVEKEILKKYFIAGFIDTNGNFPKAVSDKYACYTDIPDGGYDYICITSAKYYYDIYNILIQSGVNKECILPSQLLKSVSLRLNSPQSYNKICKDLDDYSRMNNRENFRYRDEYQYYIDDSRYAAGSCTPYYWQDLWAAARIIEKHPGQHYDIGSRIDGFIAHLQAAKINTYLIDIRPMDLKLPYVHFKRADATNLDGIDDSSVESISALCSLEHFGLGRYGDEVDPEACFKVFKSIQRVTKPNGHIYISVPIGWEHVEYNAHRVFYISTIIREFDKCELVDVHVNTLANGNNVSLIKVDNIHEFDDEKYYGGNRFGLFEFIKR